MTDTAESSPHLAEGSPLEDWALHDWAIRPWLFAIMLAVAGLLLHFATDGEGDHVPWRMAIAAFVFFAPLAAAFTLERDRIVPAAIFSGIVGIAMAGLAWRTVRADDYAADASFWFFAGVIAVLLAVPLFQADFHRDRMDTSYRATHFHVWADAVSGAGALAFVGLSWALIAILASLFELLDINLLRELTNEDWFGWMFSGAAFGAALGVLRNQLRVLGTLLNVVMLVLSILAVPLAAGLVLFLFAMIVSGPQVLWNATDSATPILLACAVGAFVLSNAVLRDSDAEMAKSKLLRIAALVLALSIAPLAIFAAVSMGVRVAQHGLSPERIWGLIAISVAVIYGVAYALSVLRGWRDWRGGAWRDRLRRANLHMALLVCGTAIILALPLFDFGAISTRDQLARLKSGEVSLKQFDMAALRWDFGAAGRAAVRQLAKSDDEDIAKQAKIAMAQEYRPYRDVREDEDDADERIANLRMEFDNPALRERTEMEMRNRRWVCQAHCVAVDTGQKSEGVHNIALIQGSSVQYFLVDLAEPVGLNEPEVALAIEAPEAQPQASENSEVEIRPWSGRRIYVDGEPLGEPFE